MSGASNDLVKQRELLGAIATIYRSEGWLVTDLHCNKTNPVAMSGPDFMMLRGPEAIVVKGLTKGDLSANQAKMRDAYVAAGLRWVTYYPSEFRRITADAEG